MRGAIMAPQGKSILVLPSTARNGSVSRIVPFLKEGTGITLTRGDIHYVITEYGIAYIHGRSLRERAMSLIAIAHPAFQPALLEQAKRQNLIYESRVYAPGKKGLYPEHLETRRKTKTGLEVFLRPVKTSDEAKLRDFLSPLPAATGGEICRDFLHAAREPGDAGLVDYTREMAILALLKGDDEETFVGLGKYVMSDDRHTAEVAVLVSESRRNLGVGTEILWYLKRIARRRGLLGFTAKVAKENEPALRLFDKMDFDLKRKALRAEYLLDMRFKA